MALFKEILGIDLGTHSTVIFSKDKGIVLEEPSIVAVDSDKKILAIGLEAKEMFGKTPDKVEVIRPIVGGVICDYVSAEAMINYFINKVLSSYTIFKPEIMVSIPSSVSSTERRAVMEVVLKSGAKEVFVVREAVLSAVGSGIKIQEPRGRMIINIGAGTTDVAVVSLGGVVVSKSIKIAGDSFNQSIINIVKKNHNAIIGERTAENIKKAIGSATLTDEISAVLVKAREFSSGLPREIKVTSDEVFDSIQNDLKNIVKVIRDVFFETPPEISADIFETGILITGGSSLLKNIDIYIQKELGVQTFLGENPLHVVALGTGIILDHIDMYKRSVISKKAE